MYYFFLIMQVHVTVQNIHLCKDLKLKVIFRQGNAKYLQFHIDFGLGSLIQTKT